VPQSLSGSPYREAAPGSPDPYLAAWGALRDLRCTRGMAAAGLAACLAVVVVVLAHDALDALSAWMALGLTCMCAALILGRDDVTCPHCCTTFGFTNRCAACGIRVGTPRGVMAPARWVTDLTRSAVARDTATARSLLLAAVALSMWPLLSLVQHWRAFQNEVAWQLEPWRVHDLPSAIPTYAMLLSPAVLALVAASAFVSACAKQIPSNVYAWVAFPQVWLLSFGGTVLEVFSLWSPDLRW